MPAYTAWAAPSKGAPLAPLALPDRPLAPHEVEIAVEHCAICHSDLHVLDDDWGISKWPLVPGHEIVGRVVATGSAVRTHAAGDVVGVGWQRGAMRSMLAFAAEHAVAPWIETAPMTDVNAQIARVRRGEPRYRVVLNAEKSK